LFINTTESSEVFALRSVNGIGVVDLVEDFNKALTARKTLRSLQKTMLIIGIIITLSGLWVFQYSLGVGFAFIVFGGIFAIPALIGLNRSNIEPELMSAVRIMISGGNRDFKFNKTGIKSGNVAEFVVKVESTLTAYHKNNY
jgi:hypothetical protein